MLFLQHRLLLSCCQRLVIGGEMLHPRLSSVLPLLLLFCSPSISSADFWKSDKDPLCFNLSTPYPFGLTTSDFIFRQPLEPGFNITCYVTDGPVIHLNGMPYKVLDISLDGYIRIDGSVIAWQCNDGSSGDNVFSLEGTPFTFSDTRNKFTAVGCDAMALIRNGTGGTQSEYSGGCVSFCASQKSIIDGVCSGMGCCQASVPRGLQRLDLVFQSIRKLTRSTEDDTSEPCNWAFVVEQDAYKFSREHLDWSPQNKNKFPRKDLDGSPQNQNVPVVLEWSIGRGSCEEVKNSTDYACKENSDCYNPPNAIGYRCNCSQGFRGNPYEGCEDIDECRDESNNPCLHKCVNMIGDFYCKCPLGMIGDGKKQGSGCNRTATPDIALGVGLAFLVIVFILGFWTYWLVKLRCLAKQKQRYFLQNGGLLLQQQILSQGAPARVFTSSELNKATNNFSEDHIIGRGGYGTVYKGLLSDQMVVAVKKSRLVDQSQMEQFINEVVILSQINHKNVVKLLGCCLETEVPLLVYEFISNGALSHHLHNTTSPLMPWEDRLRIAIETASALAYLHMATNLPIIHRDVKSANILLDESYTAKVSDFGASRLVPYNQTHVTTLVQGTLGYLDPEYFHTSQLTEKSDVYSFGVVLVELLTREKPISYCRPEEGRNLASHFTTSFEQNRLLEIVDSVVANEAGQRHVNVVAHLALKCLRLKGEERPRMIEVAIELEALRRLMKQHMAQKSKEPRLLQEEARCHGQMHVGELWSLCRNDMVKDESMESNLLSSMDLPC